jgi:hypothetical protein
LAQLKENGKNEEQVYVELEKLAKERFTSVPKIVEYLISKSKKVESEAQ